MPEGGETMLISVDFCSETPIYMQIYEQIVLAIADGDLAPGESLPSVRRLSEDIGVNIHTVNKAYAILRDEGYLKMFLRTGAAVATKMPDKENIYPAMTDRLKQLSAQASIHGITQDEFLRMAADAYHTSTTGKNGNIV